MPIPTIAFINKTHFTMARFEFALIAYSLYKYRLRNCMRLFFSHSHGLRLIFEKLRQKRPQGKQRLPKTLNCTRKSRTRIHIIQYPHISNKVTEKNPLTFKSFLTIPVCD